MTTRGWVLFALTIANLLSSRLCGEVYLTSYTFTIDNLPTIYTDESLPSPYKLRAKFSGNFHATDLFNNNWTRLQGVPGTGTYSVDLYWVKYSADGSTLLDIGPFYSHPVTVLPASNSAPTIQWTSAPSMVQEGESYFIQAMGSDANGNLTQVNVWKEWSPFGFGGGGNGSIGYSGNPSVDSGGQSITYQAQAVDAAGATSPVIYHTVRINKKPLIWWELAPDLVNYQSFYSIRARAQDADGNLTTVNIYRIRDGIEEPFAFELNGSGSDAYSDNPDYSWSYNSVTYRAEALDATGVSSGSIYHTVYVANNAPNAAWSSTTPGTTTLLSGALQIDTFIGQSYRFSLAASDSDANLQQVRAYEYAWEDIGGTWVERQSFQPMENTPITSSGAPITRSFDRIGGKPMKWNYQYVVIARDTAGWEDSPVGDNLLFVHLDNRTPAQPTFSATRASIMVGQTVLLQGAGSDPDQNATYQHIWYRGPDQGPGEWIYLTTDAHPGGTGTTGIYNFPFTPQKPGTYLFKTQVEDPYSSASIVDVSPLTVEADLTPPNAPSNLAVAGVTPTWVYLSWTPSTSPDVTEQHLYWLPAGGGLITDILLNINVTSLPVTGLSPGNSYRFYLKARDGSGNYSAPSNEVTTVTPVPPTVVVSPSSQTVNAGQSVVLTVTATGSAPLSYQWLKNGVNLPNGGNVVGATASTLTLTSVQAADAASYQVVVSNSADSVMSGTAVITVLPVPPVILSQPATQAVAPGQSAAFAVLASGSMPFAYQWRKDGIGIPGATANTYVIASAQAADAANAPGYTVVITNSVGSAVSSPAALTVSSAPIIVSGPASQVANPGTTVIFTVVASGMPAPVFQWRKNGNSIPGATTTGFTIANAQPSDAGVYSVVVSNTLGSAVSSGATLVINSPSSLAWVTAAGGANALSLGGGEAGLRFSVGESSVTVVALGFQRATDTYYDPIVRLRNSTGIVAAQTVPYAAVPVGTTAYADLPRPVVLNPNETYWLTMEAANYNGFNGYYAGVYARTGVTTTAVAVLQGCADAAGNLDAVGAVVDFKYTTAAAAPTILSQPSGQSVAAGAAALFTVSASGTGPLTYQWSKDGVPVSGATAATYGIPSAQSNDAASAPGYTVVVTNTVGSVTSAPAILVVNTPPTITTGPASRTVPSGTPTTFTVVAAGSPTLRYQWQKDGVDIPGAIRSSLAIDSTQAADAGAYSVTVSNDFGTATSGDAFLTVNVASVAAWIMSVTGSSNIALGSGEAGLLFSVGPANLTVTTIGFQRSIETYHDAVLRLRNATGVLTAVTVPYANVAVGEFSYADLPAPVVLNAGETYWITFESGSYNGFSGYFSPAYARSGISTTSDATLLGCADATGSSDSIAAVLDFKYAVAASLPTIVTQPLGRRVAVGGTAAFTVVASGTAPLSYQWQKDGVNIPAATTPSYAIASTQTGDAGSYDVVVSNLAGSVTSATARLVIGAPQIELEIHRP